MKKLFVVYTKYAIHNGKIAGDIRSVWKEGLGAAALALEGPRQLARLGAELLGLEARRCPTDLGAPSEF